MDLDVLIDSLPKVITEEVNGKSIESGIYIRYSIGRKKWMIGYGKRRVLRKGSEGSTIGEAVTNLISVIREQNGK
jgi:hypothetical protein